MSVKKTQKVEPWMLLILLVLSAVNLDAQVGFQFMPALNGQSLNGLFTVQVHNTGVSNYFGKIKITVREDGNRLVLIAVTPDMVLKPGGNLLTALVSQSRLQFGNHAAGGILSQTGRFPAGTYEYCFEFTGADNKANAGEQVFENCFNYDIQPVVALNLVYPADGEELCNTRPELSWQPAIPLNNNLRYRLMLTEKKTSQSAADALMNNAPVLQQDNIAGFMLRHPPQAPSLQKDKIYVWQVTALLGNTKLTQSEIWAFSIQCDGQKIDSSRESYRELSGSLNGNFYIISNTLRFTIINPYSMAQMDYSITDLSDPVRKISNLPAVKLQTGLNKVDIEMESVKGLESGRIYLIKINNIGNQPLYMRFIYKADGY